MHFNFYFNFIFEFNCEGIILGSKIFVNFMKYEFSECMRRLLTELKPYNEIPEKRAESEKTVAKEESKKIELKTFEQKPKIKNPIQDWNENDVSKWMNSKLIHPIIAENLKGSNGNILYEIFLIKEEFPQYYYQSIASTSNGLLTIKEIALFNHELKSLLQI